MQSDTSIIKDIYNVIDSIDPDTVTMSGEDGKPTSDRESARVISFPYYNYGKISISTLNPSNLLVLLSPNIEDNMDEKAIKNYKNFIMRLKHVSDMKPDVRFTINKVTGDDFQKAIDASKASNLESAKEKELSMNSISEAMNPMFGSTRSSYQQLDNIKMIVKHARPVDESVKGSRTRAIKSIYLENSQGERFKLPVNNLWAGRAMARHMVNNGTMYDVVGQRILEWAGRIGKLQKFQRYVKNNGLLNENTTDIMAAVSQNITDAKEILMKLSNPRHYGELANNMPAAPTMRAEDDRVNGLKETFTVKTFDESLEDTLPMIGALIMEKERDQSGDVFSLIPEVTSVLKDVMVSKKLDPKLVVTIATDISSPEGASKLARQASEIASEFSGKNDGVSNFMSRMSDMLDDHHNRMAFAKEKASPEYKKAVALVQAFANADRIGAFKSDMSEDNSKVNYMEGFKNWANLVTEGISVSPTSPDQKKKLNDLLKTELNLGEEAINAIGSLIGLIEDDKLDNMLANMAEEDSTVDARPVVVEWLKAHDLTNILEDDTKEALAQAGVTINEGLVGAALGGAAGAYVGKNPKAAMTGAQLGSAAEDELKNLMAPKEQTKESGSDHMEYDTSHGGPYDRGGADAYYGRNPAPHKYVPIEGSDGQKRQDLTDPEEIKAYHAGYKKHVDTYGPGGEKDYREDINEAKKPKKAEAKKADKKADKKTAKAKSKDKAKAEKPKLFDVYRQKKGKKPEKIASDLTQSEVQSKIMGDSKKFKPGAVNWISKPAGEKLSESRNHVNEADVAAQQAIDNEAVKILIQISNVIKEASTSMSQEVAGHLFNANKEVNAAINAAKTVSESKANLKKKLNEAPVGMGQRLGTWARGKAAGAMGPLARGWQAQIAGEKEINAQANKLGNEFRKVLGRQKINVNSPEALDALYNWANRIGLPVTDPEISSEFQTARYGMQSTDTSGTGVPGATAPAAAGASPAATPTAGPKAPASGSMGTTWNVNTNQAAAAAPARAAAPRASALATPQASVSYPKLGPAGERPGADTARTPIAPMAKGKQKPLRPVVRPTKEPIAPMGAKPGAMRPVSRRVAPSAMKEGALAESKKQIDQLIYKMVVKHDRGGNARSNPMASELPDLSALAPKAVTPAQKDTLAKVIKMLKDQGLI